jgi:hypothetical protein
MVSDISDYPRGLAYVVVCNGGGVEVTRKGCGASNGCSETKEAAITVWNMRATHTGTVITADDPTTHPKDLQMIIYRTPCEGDWSRLNEVRVNDRFCPVKKLIGCIWWPADQYNVETDNA